jgi:hypothetical protein
VVSDYTVGSTLLNVAITFIILEIFFVGLWYIATYLRTRAVGLDDFFMPLSLAFNIGLCIICLVLVKKCYVGHHITWVRENHPTALTTYSKIQVLYPMIYTLACTFPKLVILGLYLRIFIAKRDRLVSYSLIAIISLWCISVIVANGLQCIPIAYLWNPTSYPDGHCFNINEFWKWFSFPNILTDFVMFLLPFPCIWKLRLSKRDKIGLALTFCTGSVGIITSIVRFAIFFEIIDDGNQVDYTFTSVNLSCVSIAESGVYLIAACLPNYRSLFRTVRERTAGGTRTNGHGTFGESIPLNTRHTKVFGNGFSRLDNDGRALTSKGNFVESSVKVASSVDSNLDISTGKIQVKQDYAVSPSTV